MKKKKNRSNGKIRDFQNLFSGGGGGTYLSLKNGGISITL